MIKEIKPSEVVQSCRDVLGLPGDHAKLDDVLLAGLLRRCAGMLCPCSRTTLRSALVDSLNHICDDIDELAERLENLIEALIVCGDLLDLSEVAIDESDVKGTWVFPAPPSFVVRPSGSIFLIGIVSDQGTFLPESIASRVRYDGFTRLITPESDEQLATLLSEQGLQEHSEDVWLKCPKIVSPTSLVERTEQLLQKQPPCGKIDGLEILDPSTSVKFYRDRWVSPKEHTGIFIARRPQEFGARSWSVVQLDEGIPQRLMDLPEEGFIWRGCDAAWHLQMAIDHCREQPQIYRRRNTEKGVRFDFFFPLPQWFERRFLIFGKSLPREKCLLSYELQSPEAESEEQFLQERLWLIPMTDQ